MQTDIGTKIKNREYKIGDSDAIQAPGFFIFYPISKNTLLQAHLEDKINRIKLTIAEAKIIDTKQLSTDCVQIMSKVEMTNMANKAKMNYTIVSESEANLKEGKISIKTPIAQGLLNKKVGEIVEIKIPRGTIKLRIDKISFE